VVPGKFVHGTRVTGRVTVGGAGKAVSLTRAGKIGLVVFDGTAGQRVSLDGLPVHIIQRRASPPTKRHTAATNSRILMVVCGK
jgi:hypothetical protein